MFWQLNELRLTRYENRGVLTRYDYLTLRSKVREFDTHTPDGSLSEISKWFRRHPEKYQAVTPRYLELLVARVFAEVGTYVEARHVGRPGDGGVDVLLVDAEGKSWVVQVKRRESPKAVEPVDTIRNLLGALVLGRSRHGIVVSTADHFTYPAQSSARHARGEGFTIELVDRHLLDALLAKTVAASPWAPLKRMLEDQRGGWLRQEWSESELFDTSPSWSAR
ncbi:restriction endonuclease [Micromonospora sp. D75]|nr:restriction endonuclease [Micromonospora sp. D75]